MPYKDPEVRKLKARENSKRNPNRFANKARYRKSHKEELLLKHREYNKVSKESGKQFELSIWYRYRITLDFYNSLWESQNGVCAISTCNWKLDSGPNRPHIDHDHACCSGPKSCGSCIRGLLCFRHNRALGDVRDSFDELAALAVYLGKGN